jgi:hypothetical protein
MKFLFNDEESCMEIYRSNCSVHHEECNAQVPEIHRDRVQFLGGVKIILFLFLRVTDHSGPLGGTGLNNKGFIVWELYSLNKMKFVIWTSLPIFFT